MFFEFGTAKRYYRFPSRNAVFCITDFPFFFPSVAEADTIDLSEGPKEYYKTTATKKGEHYESRL